MMMQHVKAASAFAIFLIISFSISKADSKDVRVFKRGHVSLIDETQFKNPNDYSFDDEEDEADLKNAYDEKVPYLPKYILHKNGVDQGYTRVPIVTRKGSNTWSTPRPTTLRGEEYKTWGTPKILPITKPTPSHPDIVRTTTPVPKTTFLAKLAIPPLKPEKPAKKPEVKTTKSLEESSETKKFFTRKPTTTSKNTESSTEISSSTRKQFTRRPSTSASTEVTKSQASSSSSVEVITEEFSTIFSRKGSKATKPTPASEETAASTKRKFTRRPSTTTTSISASEETNSPSSRKTFTRRPTSTEGTTDASTEAASTRKKFTRKPTSTEGTTESSTEASTRKKFTRKPKPTTTTSTESGEEKPAKTKEFTKRPTTSASIEESSTEKRKQFTRRPKPTTSTSTEEPSSTIAEEEESTSILPLRERLRPMLTTRPPTPTMPRRFRVFTNPSPAEPPTDELNPQQEIENQRKLKEKLVFASISETSASSSSSNKSRKIFVAAASSSFRLKPQRKEEKRDEPIDIDSKESKRANFHFSKFAQRFGVRRIIPSQATTPQSFIIVTPVTTSPVVVGRINGRGGVEQTVKSNAIILQAQKNSFFLPSNVTSNPSIFLPSTSSTERPKVLHRWQSTWSSWTSWDANGQKISGSTKTFSTFDTPETTIPSTVTRTRQFSRTRPASSDASETSTHPRQFTRTQSEPKARIPHKPPIIHHGQHKYRGPTYNCRVLTPNEDGRPSIHNDSSCKLKFPGFPADDSCRCTYEVEARDEKGCASGFLYTCTQVARRT